MELERSRSFTVSMGHMEMYKFHATVRMSHFDLGLTDQDVLGMTALGRSKLLRTLEETVMGEITRQLLEEIEDAAALTAERKSFVKQLVLPKEPPKQPVRRTRARRS